MKSRLLSITTFGLAALVPLSIHAAESSAAGDSASALVRGNTAFALDLYAQLAEPGGNLFLSPYSVSTALGMVYAGARGETASQIAGALHFTPGNDTHAAFRDLDTALQAVLAKGEVDIRVANSIWPDADYGFLDSYTGQLKTHYGTTVTAVDFAGAFEAARERINAWVESRTADRIVDLLPAGSVDSLTRMVLVNAIYFKGDWASPFDPERTEDGEFTTAGGEVVSAPLMFQKEDFGYAEIEGGQLLELPYAGEDLSMVVLLPTEADGLPGLEARLDPDTLAGWIGSIREREVHVHLPKFTLTWGSADLKGALRELGVEDAFAPGIADFSGMDGSRELYVTAIFHKAFVEVNEEGTEAAAATGAVIGLRSMPRQLLFRADHPFLFLIRDKSTGSILFMGRITDPR